MQIRKSILPFFIILLGTLEAPAYIAGSQVDTDHLVQCNTMFALDLYQKLRSVDDNIFFSPYSISSALAMTYAGARGNTDKQMAKVLYFPMDQDYLHPAFAALQAKLNRVKSKNVQLIIANSLWGRKGRNFLPSFLKILKKYYGAVLQELDFINAPEKSRRIINVWVEEQTKGKIGELIGKGVISKYTALILANAIYFKGNWASKFEKSRTKMLPFTVLQKKTVQVPTMTQTTEFRYSTNEYCQILEIPYTGNNLSILLFLPHKIDGLPELEKKLCLETLEGWLKNLHKKRVHLYLPKFKLIQKYSLGSTLSSMGMDKAFVSADYSGIDGTKSLFISEILHKAFIELNEEGTEAAAATAVVLVESAAKQPVIFRADHPFFFIIRDKQSKSILFMGRILYPGGD